MLTPEMREAIKAARAVRKSPEFLEEYRKSVDKIYADQKAKAIRRTPSDARMSEKFNYIG